MLHVQAQKTWTIRCRNILDDLFFGFHTGSPFAGLIGIARTPFPMTSVADSLTYTCHLWTWGEWPQLTLILRKQTTSLPIWTPRSEGCELDAEAPGPGSDLDFFEVFHQPQIGDFTQEFGLDLPETTPTGPGMHQVRRTNQSILWLITHPWNSFNMVLSENLEENVLNPLVDHRFFLAKMPLKWGTIFRQT